MPARPRRRGRRDIAVAPATVRRLSEDAASGLLNLLGVPYLREHQFKLISALVVDRMDVWAQLACGAGKTLIFVAALLTLCMNGRGSIGIFIVPTAAITADMVATFVRLHIKVIELNGNTKAEAISLLRSPHSPSPGPPRCRFSWFAPIPNPIHRVMVNWDPPISQVIHLPGAMKHL
jgi:hypothetical protein